MNYVEDSINDNPKDQARRLWSKYKFLEINAKQAKDNARLNGLSKKQEEMMYNQSHYRIPENIKIAIDNFLAPPSLSSVPPFVPLTSSQERLMPPYRLGELTSPGASSSSSSVPPSPGASSPTASSSTASSLSKLKKMFDGPQKSKSKKIPKDRR